MTVTRVVRAWVVALLAAVALLVAGPAGAHSELESSDPADGATLDAAPEAVSFTFNEDLLAQGNAITVTELATDTRLAIGEVVVDGDSVSAAWPEASPAGEYRAAYRVVSADGHPIDGTITFTVATAAGEASASPAGASGSAAPSDGTSATPPASGLADPGPAAQETGAGALAWALAFGLVALGGAAAGTWYTRRSR
jgi:hypothetical protein